MVLNNLRILRQIAMHPRRAFQYVKRGFLAKDRVFSAYSRWYDGRLERKALTTLFPRALDGDLRLIKAWNRTWMTSITLEELCALLAIANSIDARRILEIGTFDGNTTLNLAANTVAVVTTVDLPPQFDVEHELDTLAFPGAETNVTDRTVLGRQLRGHPFANRIRQVFGDSARLDWSTLGGPFDLIIIDGCHDYAYVKSDTEKALIQMAPKGVILWHDYGMIEDVARFVDSLEGKSDLKLYALEGTRFAIGIKR